MPIKKEKIWYLAYASVFLLVIAGLYFAGTETRLFKGAGGGGGGIGDDLDPDPTPPAVCSGINNQPQCDAARGCYWTGSLIPGGGNNFECKTDRTAPTVEFAIPTGNTNPSGAVTGDVLIKATGSDTGGSLLKQLELDLGLRSRDVQSATSGVPKTYTWNTIDSSNGTHTYKVYAEDNAGNRGVSETKSLTVSNADLVPMITAAQNATDPTRVDISISIRNSSTLVDITTPTTSRVCKENSDCDENATGKIGTDMSTARLNRNSTTAATPLTDTSVLPGSYRYHFCVDVNNALTNEYKGNNCESLRVTVADRTIPTAPILTATPISPTQIDLSWTPSTDNVRVASYDVEQCIGASCSNFTTITLSPITSNPLETLLRYSSISLTANTTYQYRIKALDTAGNNNYSNIVSATTLAPNLTVSNISFSPGAPVAGQSVTFSAGVNNPGYAAPASKTRLLINVGEDSNSANDHSVKVDTGALASGATESESWTWTAVAGTHNYKICADEDAAGAKSIVESDENNCSPLTRFTVTTPDTMPPIISSVRHENITANGATIKWTTSEPANSQVSYGLTNTYGTDTIVKDDVTKVTDHEVVLSGLTSGVTYHYRVRSGDAGGYYANSSDTIFTTLDNVPPNIPTVLTATSTTHTSTTLGWMAPTDNVGVTKYRISQCKATVCTTTDSTTTSASITSLSPSTTYEYSVKAFDAAGNGSGYSSPAISVTTLPPPADVTPPAAPTALAAVASSPNQVNLSWTASDDTAGVLIERCAGTGCTNFAQITSAATGASYSDSGLTQLTTYIYKIKAKDAAGNWSGYSATATAFTPPAESVGPVGWWKLDEAAGNDIRDSSGNGNDGEKNGGAAWIQEERRTGISFDGTDDFAEIPYDPNSPKAIHNISDKITISAWVKHSGREAGGWAFINKEKSYEVGLSEAGVLKAAFAGNHGWDWMDSDYAVPENVWTHVAAEYNGVKVIFYVNGLKVKTVDNKNSSRVASTGPLTMNDNELRFAARDSRKPGSTDADRRGQDHEPDGFRKIKLSDVQIYNRVLSDAEVLVLAANTLPPEEPATPAALAVAVTPNLEQPGELLKGNDQWIKPLELSLDKTGGDDAADALAGMTLKITGDFPLSKLKEEALYPVGSGTKVSGLSITKNPTKDTVTIAFPARYLIGDNRDFTLYAKVSVAEADEGKKFQYQVVSITTNPAGIPTTFAAGGQAGTQFAVKKESIDVPEEEEEVVCQTGKVKTGNKCACPSGEYEYSEKPTLYTPSVCIPCTISKLQLAGGFFCPADKPKPPPTPPRPTPPPTPPPPAPPPPRPTPPPPPPPAPVPPPPAPTPAPHLSLCEKNGRYTYTGPEKPGVRVPGMCIDCPTQTYIELGGYCTVQEARAAALLPNGGTNLGGESGSDGTSGSGGQGAQTGAISGGASGSGATGSSPPRYASVEDNELTGLGGSQRLVRAPERAETGPEAAVYIGILAAVQGGLWLRKRLR